jgi:hypothetical protein
MLWVLCAVAALLLAVGSILLGVNILPGFGKALGAGTVVPVIVAWAIVATAVVSAVLLAKFLLSQRSRA